MSETPPQTLANRLARGEDAAFVELYDVCAEGLYRYATVHLRSKDAASDVVQSTFMRAVKSRRRFRKVDSPVAYVFRIARSEVARVAAKRRRGQELSIEQPESVIDCRNETHHDNAEMAAAALRRLAPDERELVELKLYAGLTFQEIAEASGQPPGTVATRYRRALESLRGWMEKQYR